jgi:uncharacterized protein
VRALRLLVVLALAGAALYDVTRAPAEQVSARTVIAGIHVYQSMVSPLLTSAGLRCRFEPSCSRYAEAVIARDGIVAGSWKALKRVARCGPWTAPGTKDVP